MFTTGLRLDLHNLLKQLLGSEHVYFQPPATVQMRFPSIVYKRDDARTEFAGNKPYLHAKRYEVTVIHTDPDSLIPDKIAMLSMCLFDRQFTANNLYHSVYTLYF